MTGGSFASGERSARPLPGIVTASRTSPTYSKAPAAIPQAPPLSASTAPIETQQTASRQTPKIEVLAPANGVIAFTSTTYSVQESSGTVIATISIQRTSGSTGAVGVTVSTADGTATAGADYTASSATLSWAAGNTAVKTFSVPVLTDILPEGNETVSLQLTTPTGGATLGTPSTATLTILDRPFDAWRARYFGANATSDQALPGADFDGDGKSNLLEYAVGTDPTVAQSSTGYTVDPQSGDHLKLSFTRVLQTTGLTFRVIGSDTLADGSWETLATKVDAAAWATAAGVQASDNPSTGAVVITDSKSLSGQAMRFLRLQVQLDGYTDTNTRIANPGEKVPSRKRGVAMNTMSAADFRALAPGVSWYYNWASSPGANTPPSGVTMTYLPMQWGNSSTSGLASYLASAIPKPPVVLAVNEPNLKGQAFINPQTTANLFAQVQAIATPYGIPVVGPQMAAGTATASSITAYDPIMNATVTYTSMTDFLNAVLYYTNAANTSVPALGFHDYGNVGELKYFIGLLSATYQRPVWVTEYAYAGAANATTARDNLIQATDFLERSPSVAGYAWFKERDSNTNYSLLATQSGVLTTLGQYYVACPPHETDLYYRLPGRLPAENYAISADCDLRATTDTDGVFDLTLASGATADYNVQVDTAGTYTVNFRAIGTGTLTLWSEDTLLGTVTTKSGWNTISTTVQLPAGPQTLELRQSGSVTAINWIEFLLQ